MGLYQRGLAWGLFTVWFAFANGGYTPKTKGTFTARFARYPTPPEPSVSVSVQPKFGILRGTDWHLAALAEAANSIIVECAGSLYVGMTPCRTINTSTLLTGTFEAGFLAQIEGVDVQVHFRDGVAVGPNAGIPDPWGTPHMCAPATMHTSPPAVVCNWPDELVLEVHPSGQVRVGPLADRGINSIVAAVAAVVVFALVLPDSKRTTAIAMTSKINRPLTTIYSATWIRYVLGDVAGATWWVVMMLAAKHGGAFLLHPSMIVVMNETAVKYLGAFAFAAFSLNAAFVVLHTAHVIEGGMARAAYETMLLCVIVFTIPVAIAPNFHAIFQFGVGCTLCFVVWRDSLWCMKCPEAESIEFILILLAGNTILAYLFMLPLAIECDSVPTSVEMTATLTAVIHMASVGYLAATRQ